MKLKANPESIRALELIQHSSMENKEAVRNILKSFLSQVVISYMRKEPIYLPYIGEFKFEYQGDSYQKEGKKAVFETEFIPDDNLTRLLGKVEDDDIEELTDLFMSRISERLGEYLDQ